MSVIGFRPGCVAAAVLVCMSPSFGAELGRNEMSSRLQSSSKIVSDVLTARKRVIREKTDGDLAGDGGSTTFGFNDVARTIGADLMREQKDLVRIRAVLLPEGESPSLEQRVTLQSAYLDAAAKIGTEATRRKAFEELLAMMPTASNPDKKTMPVYAAISGTLFKYLEGRKDWADAIALADRFEREFPAMPFAAPAALAVRRLAYAFRNGDDERMRQERTRLHELAPTAALANGCFSGWKIFGDNVAARSFLRDMQTKKGWDAESRRTLAAALFEASARLCRDCERMSADDLVNLKHAFADLESLANGKLDRKLNEAKVQYADILFDCCDWGEAARRSQELIAAAATDPSVARFLPAQRMRLGKSLLAAGRRSEAAEAFAELAGDSSARLFALAAGAADPRQFATALARLDGKDVASLYGQLKAVQFAFIEMFPNDCRWADAVQARADGLLQAEERVSYVAPFLAEAPTSADGAVRENVFDRLPPAVVLAKYRTYASNSASVEKTLLKSEKKVTLETVAGDERGECAAACDARGVHLYFRLWDREAWKSRERTSDRAALQFGIKPGADADCYFYRSLSALGKTTRGGVEWDDPRYGHRLCCDYVTVDVVSADDQHVFHVFVPWIMVYDRLPGNGDFWRVMAYAKWAGHGARSLGGGSVHEFGRSLRLSFKLDEAARQAVAAGVLKAAAAEYKAFRSEWGNADFWSDPHLGDARFFAQKVSPLLKELDAVADRLAGTRDLPEADVKALSSKYLRPLADTRLVLDGLRQDWIGTSLFSAEGHFGHQ